MKKKYQPDWRAVPVKVTGNKENAGKVLGAALVKFAAKSGKWAVVSGKLQATEVRG